MIRILVIVGKPGSGKTLLAESLVKSNPSRYLRVNQDELKTRPACENAVLREITRIRNLPQDGVQRYIVIDRCNSEWRQRNVWIQIARAFGLEVGAICLNIPRQTLEKRISSRTEHPSGVMGEHGVKILGYFEKHLDFFPAYCEGLDAIATLDEEQVPLLAQGQDFYSSEQISQFFAQLKQRPSDHSAETCRACFSSQVPWKSIEYWKWRMQDLFAVNDKTAAYDRNQ